MANVCSKCSTENADGALVCRQCGASLAAQAGWSRSLIPDDDNFDPLSAPTLVMRHTAPGELPPLQSLLIAPEPQPRRVVPRLALGLVALAVLLGGGFWLLRRPGETVPSAPAPWVAASAPSVVPVARSPAPTASTAASATVAPLPATPVAAAASSPPGTHAASAAERRKRIPEPVGRKQATQAAPVASAALSGPEPAAPPAPAATPPEPVKPKSVTETCSAGSLLTRGFCEHRECARPELAGDPVCLRIKEAEEARRFRQ